MEAVIPSFLLALALVAPPTSPPPTLYARTVQAALAHTISTPQTEYLVLDLRTHETLVDTFSSTPIPLGSLLKPFLAYASESPPSSIVCHGHPDACWRPHGPITLTAALAQSCNTYFLALAARLTPADLTRLTSLGLPPPPEASPQTLIGLTPDWRIPPRSIAQVYAALLAANPPPTVRAGLQAAATTGTARAIGPHPGGVLGKTGTAPCIDVPCVASGDGLVVALTPAFHPTLLVLVRRRATTGAVTARTAGQILTTMEALHAR